MGLVKHLMDICRQTHNDLTRIILLGLHHGRPPGGPQQMALGLEPAYPDFPGGAYLRGQQEGLDHERAADDKKSEGFLWGVPKKRKSLEKRWCVQMGAMNWHWKMLVPKFNLRICETCGHHYEAKHLCRNCYDRVQKETKLIRDAIESKFGLAAAEDKGVVVLYENEAESNNSKQSSSKTTVEVPKKRPVWFSSNLLQKTTAKPDPNTTTVVTTKPNLA